MAHPHFRSEFELPWPEYDSLMALRRVSETSPPASPVIFTRRKTKGQKAQAASERTPSRRGSLMAGLVGGDSDSSALTESGDEVMEIDQGSARQSRRNSVITGTPTEEMAEEEVEAEVADSPGKSCDAYGLVILILPQLALEEEEGDDEELPPRAGQLRHQPGDLGDGESFQSIAV